MSDNFRVNYKKLENYCKKIFMGNGLSEEDAGIVADSLVDADLRNVASHGVVRAGNYVDRLTKGGAKAKPDIKIIKERLRNMTTIPANSINDIEHLMKNKKDPKKFRDSLLGVGIISAFSVSAIALWIAKGILLPFAIGMPFAILICLLLAHLRVKDTSYFRAERNNTSKSTLWGHIFSTHTAHKNVIDSIA